MNIIYINPIISWNKAIFGPKNHETILSQARGANLVSVGVLDPSSSPYFYEIPQNILKFGNQKSRFFGGLGGGFGFEPSKMILYMINYYFRRI